MEPDFVRPAVAVQDLLSVMLMVREWRLGVWVKEGLGVILTDAGDILTLLEVNVWLGVKDPSDWVGVTGCVKEGVFVRAEGVRVSDHVRAPLRLPLEDGERSEVGDGVTVGVRERRLGVGLNRSVIEKVGVRLGLGGTVPVGGVSDGVHRRLGVHVAVGDREVGVADSDLCEGLKLKVSVLGVKVGEGVTDGGEAVAVSDPGERVQGRDPVDVGVRLRVPGLGVRYTAVGEAVAVGEADGPVPVGEGDTEGVGEGVGERGTSRVLVRVPLSEDVPLELAEGRAVGVGDTLRVGVCRSVGEGLTEDDWVREQVGLAVWGAVGAEGVPVELGLPLGVQDQDQLRVGMLGLWLAVRVPLQELEKVGGVKLSGIVGVREPLPVGGVRVGDGETVPVPVCVPVHDAV